MVCTGSPKFRGRGLNISLNRRLGGPNCHRAFFLRCNYRAVHLIAYARSETHRPHTHNATAPYSAQCEAVSAFGTVALGTNKSNPNDVLYVLYIGDDARQWDGAAVYNGLNSVDEHGFLTFKKKVVFIDNGDDEVCAHVLWYIVPVYLLVTDGALNTM